MSTLLVLVFSLFVIPQLCLCNFEAAMSVVQEGWKWHVLAKSSDAGSENDLGWELYVSYLNYRDIWYYFEPQISGSISWWSLDGDWQFRLLPKKMRRTLSGNTCHSQLLRTASNGRKLLPLTTDDLDPLMKFQYRMLVRKRSLGTYQSCLLPGWNPETQKAHLLRGDIAGNFA